MSPLSPSPPALEGRTVLLLEDEGLIVLDVTLALEAEGARVLGAGSVAQGLRWLERDAPDAAVLDLKLTGGDTCEPVAERLLALGVPFLIHTGDALRHKALLARLGAPVLQKPCVSHLLAERLVRLLAEWRPAR